MPTKREIHDRLFPNMDLGNGWSLSLQGDKDGYACYPKQRFKTVEEYDAVEVMVSAPFDHPIDFTTLGIPADVLSKFQFADDHSYAIGCNLRWDDIEALKTSIITAVQKSPNAGIPRGSIVWSGKEVFHGTSRKFAEDIERNGIDIGLCGKGYFGLAFYVAEEKKLALSNYADFSDDEGAVLSFQLSQDARILDLRNPEDSEVWMNSNLAKLISSDRMPFLARELGIDGVYDRSVGGLAIYNPKIMENCEVLKPESGYSPS